ncbi:MAG: hypothetical protein KatS3mg022_1136 [Armatimonadota bacterium]|nr:MAG: hypothetical protein KatS3mg022_1136 [Armatimonadota bacterium]
MEVGRLKRVPLREIWGRESSGFTKWLSSNLDLIEEVTGLRLSLLEREKKVGSFFADILAEDDESNLVVIENQLEPTDHEHLGKLLTYMSNLDVKTAIWIANTPRLEHEKAVNWLNEISPADTAIFLLRIEAVRIGDSPPAPLFTLIAGPNSEQRSMGKVKKEMAERHRLRRTFWEQLLERAKKSKLSLFERISPSIQNWISAGAGKSGIGYAFVIRMEDAQVEVYIDTGEEAANKRIFDALYAQKEMIEQEFGNNLDWQRLEGKRACRIRYVIEGGGLQNTERWEQVQDRMIEAMKRLEKAFQARIAGL